MHLSLANIRHSYLYTGSYLRQLFDISVFRMKTILVFSEYQSTLELIFPGDVIRVSYVIILIKDSLRTNEIYLPTKV